MIKMNLQTFADSAKEYVINVKNLVYAVLTTDTKTGVTYGAVKPFASLRQIQITPTLATGTCYGNGTKEKEISKITGYDVQAEVNKVPIEVRADIWGHKIVNGVLVVGDDDVTKEIALGFEAEQTGGTRELTWLLKGTPQPFGNTKKQSEKDISFGNDSMKISFVSRTFDGKFEAIGDTAYPDFTAAMADAFLSAVPTSFAVTP